MAPAASNWPTGIFRETHDDPMAIPTGEHGTSPLLVGTLTINGRVQSYFEIIRGSLSRSKDLCSFGPSPIHSVGCLTKDPISTKLYIH